MPDISNRPRALADWLARAAAVREGQLKYAALPNSVALPNSMRYLSGMTKRTKPGPKPRPDSLTDAPVVAVKVPARLLRGLDKKASARGVTRAESIRDAIEKSIEEKAMDKALGTIHDLAVEALTGSKEEMHAALEKIASVARYRFDALPYAEKAGRRLS